MGSIDWKKKLSSRKFWLAVIGFITPLLTMIRIPDNTVAQIASIIMAGAALIAYILSEGFVDAMATSAAQRAVKDKKQS